MGRGWVCAGWDDATEHHPCATPGAPPLDRGAARCGGCYARQVIARRPREEVWGSINDVRLPHDRDEAPAVRPAPGPAPDEPAPVPPAGARTVDRAAAGRLRVDTARGIVAWDPAANQAIGSPVYVRVTVAGGAVAVRPATAWDAGAVAALRARGWRWVECAAAMAEEGDGAIVEAACARRDGAIVATICGGGGDVGNG